MILSARHIGRAAIVRLLAWVMAMAMSGLTGSCIHEFPDNAGTPRRVVLDIVHHFEWTSNSIELNRGDQDLTLRYHLCAYALGDASGSRVLAETQFTSDDLSRPDFTTELWLPPGLYRLVAWSDVALQETGQSKHYDSSDFSSITYSEPYDANNELRDAFRGETAVMVDYSEDADYYASATLEMERPLARYEFISTDLDEFLKLEGRRRSGESAQAPDMAPSRSPDIEKYHVKMIYTGYMPHVFNNLANKPVNSKTGVSYDANITVLDGNEARLGFDHVMVNGVESSIAVAMELYDADDKLIGTVSTVNVPTKRSQNTTVRGKFLTSRTTGGVGIDPGFNGSYDIVIK